MGSFYPRQRASDGHLLRLIIVGSGRAAGTLALSIAATDHDLVGVLARSRDHGLGPSLDWDSSLPEADIVLVAVSDDAIPEVVERLQGHVDRVAVIAHLSGFVPVTSLHPLQESGIAVGGFHPLVSMPDPTAGASSLSGAFVGIGGDPLAVDTLTHLGQSFGLEPFRLEDHARPAYHAAAAAAANFVVTSLAVSDDLLASVHIDPGVLRPLVAHVVANVFDQGAADSLTGPIARGDVDTVIGHLTAANEVSESVGTQFRLLAEATSVRAGRDQDLKQWR